MWYIASPAVFSQHTHNMDSCSTYNLPDGLPFLPVRDCHGYGRKDLKNKNAFQPSLEQMPTYFIPDVKPSGIVCAQPLHGAGKILPACSQQSLSQQPFKISHASVVPACKNVRQTWPYMSG